MAKYRKKPVIVDAFLFTGESNLTKQDGEWQTPAWFVDAVLEPSVWAYPDHIEIKTLEGNMRAAVGDWIIRGIKGEIYPCKPDIFEATYELAGTC